MINSPQCLVCGKTDVFLWASASDEEYRTTDKIFEFYRCQQCEVLSINPVPISVLGIIYPKNYYSFAAAKPSLISKVKSWLDRRIFKSLLHKISGDSLQVLDIGGGSGGQLDVLRTIDSRIKGTHIVDLDSNADLIAREKGHHYFCGRIEDFQSDIKFDLILLLNLIEHVADPALVLSKIRSMLSPNGIVLIKTPNYDALDARLFRHKNWGGYHCPRHWVLFTKESFAKLAAQVGLSVNYFSYTQGAPFWATSLLYWLAKKGIIKAGADRPVVYHPLFGLLSAGFAAIDSIRKPFFKTSQMFFVLSK